MASISAPENVSSRLTWARHTPLSRARQTYLACKLLDGNCLRADRRKNNSHTTTEVSEGFRSDGNRFWCRLDVFFVIILSSSGSGAEDDVWGHKTKDIAMGIKGNGVKRDGGAPA